MKIAVFIDFDNIEIGVKTTLGQPFDIAAILEGIKERGEVVTKVAYGDWKRAGDHGRLLSQHAIRMVQRNLTPGGDKNGADINLALDALEMAFTHDHINAFVIVGGDSDFITLVEKLKQYDKKVFVVGGRQFTSLVMQKNCHEFIAYENLVGGRRPGTVEKKGGAPAALPTTEVTKAIPLVKRALKVLVDREVSPQLGLLKSTLLQLDSTFSERDYGVSTFRDFIEKVAQTGVVTLRHAGRSVLVELADGDRGAEGGPATSAPQPTQPAARLAEEAVADSAREAVLEDARADHAAEPRDAAAPTQPAADSVEARQAIQHVQELFQRATQPPRWPMYVRQVKQYLRGADEGFDERKLGFGTIVELLRACQREGVFRLERDRQGVLRVFPGTELQRPIAQPGTVTEPADVAATPGLPLGEPAGAGAPLVQESGARAPGTLAEPDVAEGVTIETEPPHDLEPGAEFAAEGEAGAEGDRPRSRVTRPRRTPRKAATGRPAARKSTGAKATPRARKAKG